VRIDKAFKLPFYAKASLIFIGLIALIFAALWDIPGMLMAIPLTAIVKLVFDHIESLKPWGFLFGDTIPTFLKIKPIRLRRIKNKPD
jgi:hypothetical protein